MSRVLGLTALRALATVAAATAVSGGIAVSVAAGAFGSNAPAASPSRSVAAPVTCTAANTRVKVAKVTRPYNHLLLSAKNTGDRTCNAFSAPFLRMGAQAQAVTYVIEETKPQAVVTLHPGETAYAGIIVSGIDQREDDYTARTLGVYFDGGTGDGSVGPEAKLKLPGKGVINADDAMVTYWQQTRADALGW